MDILSAFMEGMAPKDVLLLGMYALSLVLSGITMKFVLQTEKKQEIERNRRNKLEFSWDDWQTSIWVDAYLIFLRRQAAPHSHAVDFTFRLAFNNYGEGIRLLEERGLQFRVRNHRGEEGRCVDDKMLQFSPDSCIHHGGEKYTTIRANRNLLRV